MLLTNQKTINYENLLQFVEQTTSLHLQGKVKIIFMLFSAKIKL
jgi:hypothetical protein